MRVRYGVSFVSSKSGLCSVAVLVWYISSILPKLSWHPFEFRFCEDSDMLHTQFLYDSRIFCPSEPWFYPSGMGAQLALRRWPNVGIGRHRRDRQPTSRQRWYSVACVATVCWHSVGARRLAYRSLPMFCVWTTVVGIKCFSNKCCRSTRLSIHQLHI